VGVYGRPFLFSGLMTAIYIKAGGFRGGARPW
jgi:hypothetical protein